MKRKVLKKTKRRRITMTKKVNKDTD
jgi:hypothetical protein